MLDRAGDADSDVEVRADHASGLADLVLVIDPSGVDGRTRGAHRAAESVREIADQREVRRLLQPAAAGDDDVRLGDRHLARLGHLRIDDLRLRVRADVDLHHLAKGIQLFRAARPEQGQVIATYDVTHKLACLLKALLEADPRWLAFGRQCAICHTIDKGGPNGFGPNLFGIVGRRAGTSPDFKYSNAFKTTATFEWSEGLLGHWISLPAVMVPGTTMGIFPGVAERDRDDIVAYVASQR